MASGLHVSDVGPQWSEKDFGGMVASLGVPGLTRVVFHRGTGRAGTGYGFLDFDSHDSAAYALQVLQGAPNTIYGGTFRLKWGGGRGGGGGGGGGGGPPPMMAPPHMQHSHQQPPGYFASSSSSSSLSSSAPSSTPPVDYSVFLGDVPFEATEDELLSLFRPAFGPGVTGAKVMREPSGRSRGIAFIRFSNPRDAQTAVATMQGVLCQGRRLRLAEAVGGARGGGSGGGAGGGGGGDPMQLQLQAQQQQMMQMQAQQAQQAQQAFGMGMGMGQAQWPGPGQGQGPAPFGYPPAQAQAQAFAPPLQQPLWGAPLAHPQHGAFETAQMPMPMPMPMPSAPMALLGMGAGMGMGTGAGMGHGPNGGLGFPPSSSAPPPFYPGAAPSAAAPQPAPWLNMGPPPQQRMAQQPQQPQQAQGHRFEQAQARAYGGPPPSLPQQQPYYPPPSQQAQPQHQQHPQQRGPPPGFGPAPPAPAASEGNTTVFVGGLAVAPPAIDADLLRVFAPLGPVYSARVLARGCGVVVFQFRRDAERALATLQGANLGAMSGGGALRLSWGKNDGRPAGATAAPAAPAAQAGGAGARDGAQALAPSSAPTPAPAPAPAPAAASASAPTPASAALPSPAAAATASSASSSSAPSSSSSSSSAPTQAPSQAQAALQGRESAVRALFAAAGPSAHAPLPAALPLASTLAPLSPSAPAPLSLCFPRAKVVDEGGGRLFGLMLSAASFAREAGRAYCALPFVLPRADEPAHVVVVATAGGRAALTAVSA